MRRFLRFSVLCVVLAATLPTALGQEQVIDLAAKNAHVYQGASGQALTSPSQLAPGTVVADFLRSRGRGEPAVLSLVPASETQDSGTGLTHLRLEQQVGGLTVYGTYVKAAINDRGELVHLIELLADPPAGGVVRAAISARQALDGVVNLYYPGHSSSLAEANSTANTTEFSHDGFFFQNPKVTRIAIPMSNGSMHEGFLVETWTDRDNLLQHTLVGRNGRIISSEVRTNDDSYNVFSEHPLINFGSGPIGAAQTIVSGPGNGNTESPAGWLSNDGQSNGVQRTFRISGNNADAYLDTDANNSPDAGGTSVTTGNFLTGANLSQDPGGTQNKEVAVQNLFYSCNVIHDKLYKHGFTEPFGNFQENNFGNGGVSSDSVLCEAQDGSGLNNANFATPSDGGNPRMQMFLWNQSSPRRDGDVDSDIVSHEYGHGLTWRMIGGMSGCMSGALGEGASDGLAILMNGDDVVAEYSYNNVNGIRRYPYTNYPLTYKNLSGGSVHANGELYGAIIWRLREKFHAQGVSDDQLFNHFVGGMKFTPSGPAYEDMRDGMLAYASNAGSGRQCLIWEAFADYGVGVGASGSCKGSFFVRWTINESTAIPSECQGGGSNNPPTANPGGPYSGTEDVAVVFNGSLSSDPDGDPLTYTWDFGDGSTGSGVNPSHTYAWGGSFSVSLTVNDGNGGSNTATTTATITEVNDKPVANPGGPYSGVAGQTITFNGSGSFDPDNQDGSATNNQTLTYSWNFGDGNSSAGVSPSHTYAAAGNYTATLTVSDGGLTSDPVNTSVDVTEPGSAVSVTGISPNSMSAGTTINSVTISGSGFAAGATVTFLSGSGPAPTASNVVVVNANNITLTVSSRSGGPSGSRVWDVQVTNPGGSSGALAGGFTVVK